MTGPQIAVVAATSFGYGLVFHGPLRNLMRWIRRAGTRRRRHGNFDQRATSTAPLVPQTAGAGRVGPALSPKVRRTTRTNEMVSVFTEELGPDDPLVRVVATATAALEEVSGRYLTDDELRTAARGEWPTTDSNTEIS